MARFTKAKEPERDFFAESQALCVSYYGPTDKTLNDFGVFAERLRALKPEKDVVQRLRDWLPIHATGPVGDRIHAIDSLLERMERA